MSSTTVTGLSDSYRIAALASTTVTGNCTTYSTRTNYNFLPTVPSTSNNPCTTSDTALPSTTVTGLSDSYRIAALASTTVTGTYNTYRLHIYYSNGRIQPLPCSTGAGTSSFRTASSNPVHAVGIDASINTVPIQIRASHLSVKEPKTSLIGISPMTTKFLGLSILECCISGKRGAIENEMKNAMKKDIHE